jgi:hypothetical protein
LTTAFIDEYDGTLGSDSIRSARLFGREITFGLKPVVQFTARFGSAGEINLVGASPDFVLTRGHTEHDLSV